MTALYMALFMGATDTPKEKPPKGIPIFPKMYALAKTGSVRMYQVEVIDLKDHAKLLTHKSVTMGGKVTTDTYEYWEGVNIGKSNETTYLEQAINEATSICKKLLDAGFTEGIPTGKYNTDARGKIKPMLAISFNEGKIKFPCLCQPKFDGCVFGGTKLLTDEGYLPIKDIVENKIKTKVLSQDSDGNLLYKRITGWANNGTERTEWFTITVGTNVLHCTGNHRVFTERGYVRADELLLTDRVSCKGLPEYSLEILTGMLFGDSCLLKDSRSNSWKTSIASNSRCFLTHKANMLGLEYSKISEYISGYGTKCWRTSIEAVTSFIDPLKYMEYRSKKYRRRLCIPVKELLCMLTDNSLSVWYADDGSLMYNNGNRETPRITLNTQRYSREQLSEFIKYFVIKYDCCPTVVKDKRLDEKGNGAGCVLTFTTKDTFKILEILKDKALRGVEHKYYYKDIKYLEESGMTSYFKEVTSITSKVTSEVKYDIEVEGTHNYFANGVLVHNCRMTMSEENGKIHLLSRKGKEFNVPHLTKWALEHRDLLPLDGELYNHKDLSFQEIVSAVKRYSPITDKIRYAVYDRPVEGVPNLERWRKLIADFEPMTGDCPVYRSDWVYCDNIEQVRKYHDKCVANGYEGVIIRNFDGEYEFGFRSSDLIKLKEFNTDEFPISEVVEATGRDAGTGVFVLTTKDGGQFNAKPQGTRELRKEYFDNRESLVGKMVTVQYQGVSDEGIPRFPSAISIRDYE